MPECIIYDQRGNIRARGNYAYCVHLVLWACKCRTLDVLYVVLDGKIQFAAARHSYDGTWYIPLEAAGGPHLYDHQNSSPRPILMHDYQVW